MLLFFNKKISCGVKNMTVALTIATNLLIIMAVDSAVTLDFGDHREYDTGRKHYYVKGVGCVTTWGELTGNQVARFLDRQALSQETHTIDDLASLVYQYLTQEYRPDEAGLGEVGYHVAGFDRQEQARLYHVFWAFDRPRRPDQESPEYKMCDHSPEPMIIEDENQVTVSHSLLYNGRSDIVGKIVKMALDEYRSERDARYRFHVGQDLFFFSDLVMRFTSEITPEVGPPFYTYLIAPDQNACQVVQEDYYPIRESQEKVEDINNWIRRISRGINED